MSHIRRIAHQNRTMLLKTASYYVIHICVAAMVAYAVTGNLLASLTLSLLEPGRLRFKNICDDGFACSLEVEQPEMAPSLIPLEGVQRNPSVPPPL